ncbi:MAG: hypothetical protein EP298_10960 [Gammaproteobacteria bacterium]|nr:MAG: hypothetical protein EP298_10960 [Gammaproteobacteria bacterium]UTW41604.1 hypothetical protein KFE69_08800 [bacterium SCSIO 12844]
MNILKLKDDIELLQASLNSKLLMYDKSYLKNYKDRNKVSFNLKELLIDMNIYRNEIVIKGKDHWQSITKKNLELISSKLYIMHSEIINCRRNSFLSKLKKDTEMFSTFEFGMMLTLKCCKYAIDQNKSKSSDKIRYRFEYISNLYNQVNQYNESLKNFKKGNVLLNNKQIDVKNVDVPITPPILMKHTKYKSMSYSPIK